MSDWRLLECGTNDAFMNMATDEAILRARINDEVPNTIRFYRWNPSAVSIGKFQDVENEVQLDNCRKCGVDVVRRITGGGTVYHDAQEELTYSVIAEKEDLRARDITQVYARIYAGLAEALKTLGVTADFSEGNAKTCPNLTVNGKKISGSAQCHKSGVVLQHGTLLVKVDLERMFELLRVPWAKTRVEVIEVARRRITSITDELKRDISMNELESVLVDGFQKALGTVLKGGDMTGRELELAKTLFEVKFTTSDWNYLGRSKD
jgi:lipoate-protein ligase A